MEEESARAEGELPLAKGWEGEEEGKGTLEPEPEPSLVGEEGREFEGE